MHIKNNKIYIYNNDIKTFGKNQFHKFLKQSLFSGKIIIFRNNYFIIKTLNLLTKILEKSFLDHGLNDLDVQKNNIKLFNRTITIIQDNIKKNLALKNTFKTFLNFHQFSDYNTFIDKITLRYTSPKYFKSPGVLKPLEAHRDTWGSNIFEQINWWIPLFDIHNHNSLYILEDKFKKKINNNSDTWDFKKYKNNSINILSSPVSKKKFKVKSEYIIRIKRGDMVCFSGHHLHGSSQDNTFRINLETRTVTKTDINQFKIPKNIDNYSNKKKKIWFKNIHSSLSLNKTNY